MSILVIDLPLKHCYTTVFVMFYMIFKDSRADYHDSVESSLHWYQSLFTHVFKKNAGTYVVGTVSPVLTSLSYYDYRQCSCSLWILWTHFFFGCLHQYQSISTHICTIVIAIYIFDCLHTRLYCQIKSIASIFLQTLSPSERI